LISNEVLLIGGLWGRETLQSQSPKIWSK